jgi:hypothetical protein
MCLPFASLSHITSSLYTCTLAHLSEVCVSDVLNLFIGMIADPPPGFTCHLIPIAQTSPSQFLLFPSPPSPLPQGRQVGFLK